MPITLPLPGQAIMMRSYVFILVRSLNSALEVASAPPAAIWLVPLVAVPPAM